MQKTKKIFFIISIIILMILITIIGYKIYDKNLYSLENYDKSLYSLDNIEKILNEVKLPEKYNAKEMVYDSSNNLLEKVNYYINDEGAYICQESKGEKVSEQIYDFNNLTHITIIHTEKTITNNPIQGEMFDRQMYSLDTFSALADLAKKEQSIYQYEGKEEVNGKKCIKISFSAYSLVSNKTIFFIDEKSHYIQKMEYYVKEKKETLMKNNVIFIERNFKKQQTYNYEYTFDVENKNDILKFNVENYPDYTYVEGNFEQEQI